MPLPKSLIPLSALPLLLAGQSPTPITGVSAERPGACEITLSPEPLFVVGRGEHSTDILHRVAGGVILPTGDVVIANAGDFELRWHDARGRLVRTAGRRGGGPGEFTALTGIWLFRDSLVVTHDFSASRVEFFTLDGIHRRTTPLPLGAGVRWPAVVGVIDSSLVAINGQRFESGEMGRGRIRPPFVFIRFSTAGTVVDTLLTVPGRESWVPIDGVRPITQAVPFGRTVLYSFGPDRMIYGDTGDSVLRVAAAGRGTTERFVHGVPRHPLGDDTFRDFIDKARRSARTPPQVARAEALGRIPKPRLLPAIDQLHLDDEGRIWIRPFEYPGQGPRVWRILAGGTSHACTAVLPPRTRILDIRGRHLLALVRSPEGVEEVRLYTFTDTPAAARSRRCVAFPSGGG